jgi:hypothetical protein
MNRGIGFGCGIVALLWGASALAAGSDELWEMSTRMDMPGMAMPAVKTTSCLPREGGYKPESGPKDKNCEVTDLKVSGNKTSWKMHCSGKDEMSGSGEMTRTADTLNGTMKMTMKGGQMTQVMAGKRIGTCDAAAEKQKFKDKIDEMNARSANAKAENCKRARASAAEYQGYAYFAKTPKAIPSDCAINLEESRVALCKRAAGEKNHKFIKDSCPAEAKAFKDEYDRNCQGFGRGYTADSAHPNAKLCRSLSFWGGHSAKGGGTDEGGSTDGAASPARKAGKKTREAGAENPGGSENAGNEQKSGGGNQDNPANAILEGAKGLKGLFKF